MNKDLDVSQILFGINVQDTMLVAPLQSISREIIDDSEYEWTFLANYRNGCSLPAARMKIHDDDDVLLYLLFKRYWLTLNKLKYGEKCHYELSHLRGIG